MSRDIDELTLELQRAHPDIRVDQLRVAHLGADDDGLWYITHPRAVADVQVESYTGNLPFLIESDGAPPVHTDTMDATLHAILDRLGLRRITG